MIYYDDYIFLLLCNNHGHGKQTKVAINLTDQNAETETKGKTAPFLQWTNSIEEAL